MMIHNFITVLFVISGVLFLLWKEKSLEKRYQHIITEQDTTIAHQQTTISVLNVRLEQDAKSQDLIRRLRWEIKSLEEDKQVLKDTILKDASDFFKEILNTYHLKIQKS